MAKWLVSIGVACLLLVSGALAQDERTIYVAPNGNDTWSGRLAAPDAAGTDGPFATLERARDEVRARRAVTRFLSRSAKGRR